jgi:hypothetical protein
MIEFTLEPTIEAEPIYLGDGLYGTFDGHEICLRTERKNVPHFIFMDKYLLENFLKWIGKTK